MQAMQAIQWMRDQMFLPLEEQEVQGDAGLDYEIVQIPEDDDEGNPWNCGICCDEESRDDVIAHGNIEGGGHMHHLHLRCLISWRRARPEHPECPMCRGPLSARTIVMLDRATTWKLRVRQAMPDFLRHLAARVAGSALIAFVVIVRVVVECLCDSTFRAMVGSFHILCIGTPVMIVASGATALVINLLWHSLRVGLRFGMHEARLTLGAQQALLVVAEVACAITWVYMSFAASDALLQWALPDTNYSVIAYSSKLAVFASLGVAGGGAASALINLRLSFDDIVNY